MPEPQLVLLRHGETAWSRTGQHTGTSDIPLTPHGEEQARAAGAFLAGRTFTLTLCSPLLRARRTAELAGHPDATVEPRLAEWDYGPVEGRTADDVSREIGHDWLIFRDGVHVVPRAQGTPGEPGTRPGETLDDVADRAHAVVQRVEPVLHDGGDVLLVAHGHLLRVLAAVWLGLDPATAARFELGTASISLLGHGHGLRTVEGWNLPTDRPGHRAATPP
ncbi:histidine phosphatase family protein [Oerskovia turbata]|uniref:phosphoglycerate mutase (2,3-diphosphoglycerate-dependent) n=1 Tax=Oerskovia turbata TaxID=1713 RepID=A0A4Q1KVX7_9CELL|nr:histidine phosphatase family protein [Oerskovia turbata]RXR25818.1 histidine phosphatase family protein [Oerskovia turbata]RXR33384.1 histidine phosphatase family protein [Oerskovia turbata]TGJ96161.1 histidine phosphatase family protein [Actinotalea fermentans ATCC 43279 = JCM 9966 = DSM 3133]